MAAARWQQVQWYELDGRRLRALVAGARQSGVPEIVIVPGLGCVRSMLRTLAVVSSWTRVIVLDLPGFGHRGPDTCGPTVPDVANALTEWLAGQPRRPRVLAGHSTGAQAALHATVAVPEAVTALVLAGLTFDPGCRRPLDLLRAWARTSRHEPPSGLPTAAPDYWRGGARALTRFVRSGLRDRPEDLIGQVSCPVLLGRGEHDHFASAAWHHRLAGTAARGSAVTVPGSHAFPHSHPELFARMLADAAAATTSGTPSGSAAAPGTTSGSGRIPQPRVSPEGHPRSGLDSPEGTVAW